MQVRFVLCYTGVVSLRAVIVFVLFTCMLQAQKTCCFLKQCQISIYPLHVPCKIPSNTLLSYLAFPFYRQEIMAEALETTRISLIFENRPQFPKFFVHTLTHFPLYQCNPYRANRFLQQRERNWNLGPVKITEVTSKLL